MNDPRLLLYFMLNLQYESPERLSALLIHGVVQVNGLSWYMAQPFDVEIFIEAVFD